MRELRNFLLLTFLFCFQQINFSQTTCVPGGTVFTSITTTGNLCPGPPGFIFMLHYEVCGMGAWTDTCGGNATRYYFINPNGQVTFKAFNSSFIQVKTGGKLNITGGSSFITVETEPGAILTGLPPGTLIACPYIGPPNGSTCFMNSIDAPENAFKAFSVYPNPFIDKLTITTGHSDETICIFNSLGSVISALQIKNGKTEVDMTKYCSGIYFIKMGSFIKKIIKE